MNELEDRLLYSRVALPEIHITFYLYLLFHFAPCRLLVLSYIYIRIHVGCVCELNEDIQELNFSILQIHLSV